MRFGRFAKLMMNGAAILIVSAAQAFACPMCKANIANAENAAEVATTVNTAILVLLAPTLAIIGGLVKLVFKYRNFQNGESSADSSRSVDSYVNLTTSGSERGSQQHQRDPAHHGLLLHSAEKHQSPPGLHD